MTKPTKYILEEEFPITSADTDFTSNLSVSSLVNMFIRIAWHHAEELGFGINYLQKNNLTWVLSRMHLKIESLPGWNDRLKLVTWPKGLHRLFYLRDLQVFNADDKCIASSTSGWLLIDTHTKRPKLQGPDEEIFSNNKDKHAIDTLIENLNPLDREFNSFLLKARYSDIDLNQHLTATRYIDWMFDTFDIDFHKKYRCSEIKLNFYHEIPYGEEVFVNRTSNPETNLYEFEFVLKGLKQILFRGNLKFKDANPLY